MVQRLSSPREETQQEAHKRGELSDGRINLFASGTPYSSSSIRSTCLTWQKQEAAVELDDVVTILAISTEKVKMHSRHELELNKVLSQLSTESSKQTNVSSTPAWVFDV